MVVLTGLSSFCHHFFTPLHLQDGMQTGRGTNGWGRVVQGFLENVLIRGQAKETCGWLFVAKVGRLPLAEVSRCACRRVGLPWLGGRGNISSRPTSFSILPLLRMFVSFAHSSPPLEERLSAIAEAVLLFASCSPSTGRLRLFLATPSNRPLSLRPATHLSTRHSILVPVDISLHDNIKRRRPLVGALHTSYLVHFSSCFPGERVPRSSRTTSFTVDHDAHHQPASSSLMLWVPKPASKA